MEHMYRQATVEPLANGVGTFLWSRAARPLRFAFTGSLAMLAQLTLLAVLASKRWPPLTADATAIAVSTEINFILSYLVTWHDRRPRSGSRAIAWRWAAYHASVGGAALINMLVFAVARSDLNVLLASALGTGVGAIANFFTSDRIVFRLESRRAWLPTASTAPPTSDVAGEGTAAQHPDHPVQLSPAGDS
jgi:putative flippase GtrA